MARHFGPVRPLALVERSRVTGVTINVVLPRPDRDSVILVTTGMSDRAQVVPSGADEYRFTELMIQLPSDWPLDMQSLADPRNGWPFEWLRRIAAYPADSGTWLGGPFAIIANGEPAEPFAPGTDLSCMLLLRENGDAGTVRCGDGRLVVLYSMFPLYSEERDLEKAEGMASLLGRFQEHELTLVVDPARVNVATAAEGPPPPVARG